VLLAGVDRESKMINQRGRKMNESKRKARDQILSENGKLIEAGWINLKVAMREVSESEAQMLRCAFFAGAHYLFSNLVTVLKGQSSEDLRRMESIGKELDEFARTFRADPKQGGGSNLQDSGRG
jgi:hypothetical protein